MPGPCADEGRKSSARRAAIAWFQKGGHNDSTGNTMVCLERRQRCVVILSNDVRSERLFPGLVRAVLGDTGFPWAWEYGPHAWAK